MEIKPIDPGPQQEVMTPPKRIFPSPGFTPPAEDLKLDKIQQFVLDECDKCLDKVDMRKDR